MSAHYLPQGNRDIYASSYLRWKSTSAMSRRHQFLTVKIESTMKAAVYTAAKTDDFAGLEENAKTSAWRKPAREQTVPHELAMRVLKFYPRNWSFIQAKFFCVDSMISIARFHTHKNQIPKRNKKNPISTFSRSPRHNTSYSQIYKWSRWKVYGRLW